MSALVLGGVFVAGVAGVAVGAYLNQRWTAWTVARDIKRDFREARQDLD